ncbi:MAG: PTS sugar transporter subunit IIA [Candidatus Auribacterota bacterium]|nr:PTS sugar transporter subunit IIA [Candidatus Auribacterota bacterium]
MEQILTLKEVAQYIKLNERTILKMAHNNEIPAKKIGNQWRFILSKVDEWLSQSVENVNPSDLDELIHTSPHVIPISRLFAPEMMEMNMSARNKAEALEELSLIPKKNGVIADSSLFLDAMQAREELMSTALSNGIAIPHPRYPIQGLFEEPRVLFGRSINGIEFGEIDGKKTHLFFVSCVPNEVTHLRVLAKLGLLLRVPNIVKRFIEAQSQDDLMRLFLELDKTDLDFSKPRSDGSNYR